MGQNVYLTGQAGSGKTYLLNKYIEFLKGNGVGIAVTASTGIAATHLSGITIHSWSGIGIKDALSERDINKLRANPKTRARIQAVMVLVIDEISMFHAYRLDMVDRVCREIRENDEPFGGLQVILCGDFFQLPPISEPDYPESSFAFRAKAWGGLELTVCYLDEQHRQSDDEFLKVLNDIRSQDVSEYTYEKLATRMNKEFSKKIVSTRLYTHNADVDAINNFELSKIESEDHKYQMQAVGVRELTDALKKGCLAPEQLVLKKGALVMFIKNNQAKGYVNGTLGKVAGFDPDGFPIVETNSGQLIIAQPASWILDDNEEVVAEISQVPLRLAWAITIHKSQGMSLDAAVIDLSRSFTYGMGYVALSRVRTLAGIALRGINNMAFLVNQEIGEMDREFKNLSFQAALALKQLGAKKVKQIQKEFLKRVASKTAKKERRTTNKLMSEFLEIY